MSAHDYTIRHAKRYAGRLTGKSNAPRSPCPICLLDGASTCTTQLMQWRCPRGHEWTSTRQQALAHAEYCNRSTWQEANR